MAALLQNNILEASEQKIESQLTPQNKVNYMKIVVAGMRAAMAKGPNSIVASLHQSKDPVSDCAVGAVKLCLLMAHTSRGTMPPKAMVPAGMTLMLHALDFCDKSGIAKIGTPELVRATHLFTNEIFKAFKISPQMLQNAATKVHGIMQDPTKMEMLKHQAGMTKNPNAPVPTPVEGEKNAV
jgi:hypothetical protein